jgi:predicted nucleic acid-binding protein
MNVYAESNLVLELAFLREEHESCATLLDMAESQAVALVLPAFSIGESYEVQVRRWKQRNDLHQRLSDEIRELSRSRPYRESSEKFQELTKLLVDSGEQEKHRLNATLYRILGAAQIIPISLETIRAAIAFQSSRDLSPQDSIVYASILEHLVKAPEGQHCFITKDAKDFANPDVVTDLANYNCRLITKFADGLGFIRSCI